jgi:hypothetical protein
LNKFKSCDLIKLDRLGNHLLLLVLSALIVSIMLHNHCKLVL